MNSVPLLNFLVSGLEFLLYFHKLTSSFAIQTYNNGSRSELPKNMLVMKMLKYLFRLITAAHLWFLGLELLQLLMYLFMTMTSNQWQLINSKLNTDTLSRQCQSQHIVREG